MSASLVGEEAKVRRTNTPFSEAESETIEKPCSKGVFQINSVDFDVDGDGVSTGAISCQDAGEDTGQDDAYLFDMLDFVSKKMDHRTQASIRRVSSQPHKRPWILPTVRMRTNAVPITLGMIAPTMISGTLDCSAYPAGRLDDDYTAVSRRDMPQAPSTHSIWRDHNGR